MLALLALGVNKGIHHWNIENKRPETSRRAFTIEMAKQFWFMQTHSDRGI